MRLWGKENPTGAQGSSKSLLLPLPPGPLSSSSSPNNEGLCMDEVSKVIAVASGP